MIRECPLSGEPTAAGPAPRLETERLILRKPEAGDLDAYVGYFTSERSQFTDGPLDAKTAWRWFGTEIGHWTLRGFGMFTVVEKTAPTVPLGLVGPFYPAGWPEPEVGWLLWEGAEGRGIGLESARACLDFVFRDLGWTTAVSYIHRENHRSITLARRLGAVEDRTAPRKSAHETVYRHKGPAR